MCSDRRSGKLTDAVKSGIDMVKSEAQTLWADNRGGVQVGSKGGSGSVQTISNKFPNDNQAGKRFNYNI